jgi:hypothetical protein
MSQNPGRPDKSMNRNEHTHPTLKTLAIFKCPSAACIHSVPEGHVRLAQCFNIGITNRNRMSPEGTAENPWQFKRPFGT